MNDAAYEHALEQKIDDLMNGEYSPFLPENLREAIEAMDTAAFETLAAWIKSDDNARKVNQYLRIKSSQFWARLAKTEAVARLENECQNCYGAGCGQCNDREE